MKYTVAVGEMFDGITFHGVFDDFEDAQMWTENNARNASTWIVQILEGEDKE